MPDIFSLPPTFLARLPVRLATSRLRSIQGDSV